VDQVDPDVNPEILEEEQALRLRLEQADAKRADFESELRSIDAEWDALSGQRVQYESLEQACQALEKLNDEGISRAFWGDRASDEQVLAHLVEVRGQIADLGHELTEVEQRRDAARKRMEQHLDVIDYIEDDLRQAIEQEQRRQQEWVVERDENELPWRLQIMPWTRRLEDDDRFRKSLLGSALACLLLGLLIPFIDIPIPEREDLIAVPERLAQFIRKEQQRPMPPVQPMRKKRIEEALPEVEPEIEPEVTPETQIAETVAPEPEPESARERMASTGLLAFRESFSNLADARPSARLGDKARVSDSGEAATGLPQRSMVVTDGPGSSGGINLAALSRDVGSGGGTGDQIEGVQLSRVASSIGASGTSDRPLSSGAFAGRTDEEIQIVFDRYKSALYRLYNRELRKDPTLRGQMVLQLTIEPDGSVSLCRLQSSDMGAPVLANQVVTRVGGFDFGPKDVPAVTILYPIDFLPTA
jgi:hypothetical protein